MIFQLALGYLAMATGRGGETSPYLTLRNRAVSRPGQGDTHVSQPEDRHLRPEDFASPSRQGLAPHSPVSVHEDQRGMGRAELVRARRQMESTPLSRPHGLSVSLPGTFAPQQRHGDPVLAAWHAGSTADLFDHWVSRPCIAEAESLFLQELRKA